MVKTALECDSKRIETIRLYKAKTIKKNDIATTTATSNKKN